MKSNLAHIICLFKILVLHYTHPNHFSDGSTPLWPYDKTFSRHLHNVSTYYLYYYTYTYVLLWICLCVCMCVENLNKFLILNSYIKSIHSAFFGLLFHAQTLYKHVYICQYLAVKYLLIYSVLLFLTLCAPVGPRLCMLAISWLIRLICVQKD